MADAKYGAPASWVDAFNPADFQALASNGGKLSTIAAALDNSANLHLYGEFSFSCVTSTWAVGIGGHLAVYLLPEQHDGTYPNTTDGAAVTDYPGGGYFFGVITFKQATLAHRGSCRGIIPPSKFMPYVVNRTGAALPNHATNMTMKFRSYAEQVS
ncbi:hypothetical protein GXW78_07570 [Roseomonas terrae]|uniref:Uncharacterized protein n=1 Tax=Neoroseomonas terrae TaxID=424799 RepID=A0ABS5EES4_9PROT|nr:hypothetical protein [Neoroseomonas terrae]MBR0649513.1 hypothetical protein [Neoroseomonas terrae]